MVAQCASLPSSIQVDIKDFGSIEVAAEYPWKPKFCIVCKISTHEDRNCKNSKKIWMPKVNDLSKNPTSYSPQACVDAAQADVDPSTEPAQNDAESFSVDPLDTSQKCEDIHGTNESCLPKHYPYVAL